MSTRPRFANNDDGCGNHWYERGRFSAWVDPLKWTFGVQHSPDYERSITTLHLGPLWLAWETPHAEPVVSPRPNQHQEANDA